MNRSINCSPSCSKRISNDNNALDVKESGLNNTKSNSKTTLHLELWLVLQAPWITTPVLQVSRNGQLKQPACSWEESHLHQWRLQVLMDQRRPHDKVGQGHRTGVCECAPREFSFVCYRTAPGLDRYRESRSSRICGCCDILC